MCVCATVPPCVQASEEIRQLQVQSQTMSTKLRNRRATEHRLGSFIEHLTVSERMVNGILEGEVSAWQPGDGRGCQKSHKQLCKQLCKPLYALHGVNGIQ